MSITPQFSNMFEAIKRIQWGVRNTYNLWYAAWISSNMHEMGSAWGAKNINLIKSHPMVDVAISSNFLKDGLSFKFNSALLHKLLVSD